TLYEVLQHLDKSASSATASSDPRTVAQISRWHQDLTSLGNLLLSSEHQNLLANAPDGSLLTVVSDLPGHRIPWESLKVQSRPLGIRFAVGRLLLPQSNSDQTPLPGSAPHPAPITGTGCVPTADNWQLISVDLEQRMVERRLRTLLHSKRKLSPLSEPPQTLTVAAFSQILTENSWVHFAGHAAPAQAGRDTTRELVLATSRPPATDRITFPLEQLQNLARVPEVLFLNSCAALQIPEATGRTQPPSLTSTLLQRGAQALIGPLVRIADSQSRQLVAAFYDELAVGASLGEALRRARLAAKDALGPNSL
ncbi:MAG: CHAT domain-containing protein, partial [Planctomycetaceae bacterium]